MTTRASLQEYADSPSSRRRLRAEGEPPPESGVAYFRSIPGTAVSVGDIRLTDPVVMLGRDLYETRSQLHTLWTTVERLESELVELRQRVLELEAETEGLAGQP